MSTVTLRDTTIRQAEQSKKEQSPVFAKADGTRSAVSRLFTWYREAVLSPATAKEEDEWQKHSF